MLYTRLYECTLASLWPTARLPFALKYMYNAPCLQQFSGQCEL